MKLMFHKQELYGQWFHDNEEPEDFSEKAPPNTGVEWDEELNEWVLTSTEPVSENITETEETENDEEGE